MTWPGGDLKGFYPTCEGFLSFRVQSRPDGRSSEGRSIGRDPKCKPKTRPNASALEPRRPRSDSSWHAKGGRSGRSFALKRCVREPIGASLVQTWGPNWLWRAHS